MAITTREQIMDALATLFQQDATCSVLFPTISRRFVMWERLRQLQNDGRTLRQPALFLFDGMGLGGGAEITEHVSRGVPKRVVLHRTIVIYASLPNGTTPDGPDFATPGGSVFHPLIEAVEQALVPDSEGAVTLGGLVSHCWIEGQTLIMTGEIDESLGQGMCTIPIRIMMFPSL